MVWGPVVSALVLLDLLNTVPAQIVQLPNGPVPPILVPSSGDVWKVGELRTVEWGIKDEPLNDSSGNPYLGFLLLAYNSGDPDMPVVLASHKLASGFSISQQIVNMIVPEVPTRKDYKIFMSAQPDSLSLSGPFEIFNPNDPQGTGSPATFSVASAPAISVTVVLPTTTNSSVSSSTTMLATSITSSNSAVSTSQSATSSQSGACPLSRNDLLTRTDLILVLALAAVLAT
ncbi:hypothetical protein C8Q74DRAFT_1370835 [Fomes fomentarius]|nr:hypothetical protein C8Q74DRAFT_1370835 [Fomes fomentarius]